MGLRLDREENSNTFLSNVNDFIKAIDIFNDKFITLGVNEKMAHIFV